MASVPDSCSAARSVNAKLEKSRDSVAFSIELFPPRTLHGSQLDQEIKRIVELSASIHPCFVSVTCKPGASPPLQATLELCQALQARGLIAVPHLACWGRTKQEIEDTVTSCVNAGVKNILALRGDKPVDGRDSEFKFAYDLVSFIRHFDVNKEFSVLVAGYPEAHPESKSIEDDMQHFTEKAKMADLIITQLFFDPQKYLQFKARVLAAGIPAKLLPGIMLVNSAKGLDNIMKFCTTTTVPSSFKEQLDNARKQGDAAVRAFGIKNAVEMCKILYAAGERCFHFYTMNSENIRLVLSELGWL